MLRKWRRNRRLIRTYVAMRNMAEEHRKEGHVVKFKAINESHLELICWTCKGQS